MSFTVSSHEAVRQLFSQWVQIFGRYSGNQSKDMNNPCSNVPVCYLLRLLCSQIPPSNEMLDIQIYNSRLKENSLLCMLNHFTRETRSSFVPKCQQLRIMCCTTDLLAEQLLTGTRERRWESKAPVTLGAGIINTTYHKVCNSF